MISSGSLKLDIQMSGGLRPGVLRLTGVTEGGKTNCALSFVRNFLASVDNSYVLYFRAEGRLSDDILLRQGLLNHPRLTVVKGNVYEKIIEMMSNQVNNNPTEARYMFILDSADAMLPIGDLEKGPEEANKVSGGALLSSDMLRRMANKFIAFGHVCIIISQKRDQVAIDKYQAAKNPRVTNASGGNALLHYSDWILEFQYRHHGDLITTLPNNKGDILGHNCKVVFRKSPNEKTYVLVEYPIRYGRDNGRSVWVEREVVDVMLAFGMIEQKGSWISIVMPILKELKEANLECPDKVQGIEKFVELLENNQPILDYLRNKLFKTLKK